jgi:zinc transport system ATP-binding protein
MDVYDLITSYRYGYPIFLRKRAIYEEIKDALKEFEADYLIDQPVGKLSGGELQRVLLSMAVMDRPNLLLLDEPVSGIDKNGMDLFYEKMDYLRKNYDMSILLISHDLDYVAQYADRVVLIDKTVLSAGTPKEVYESEAFAKVFGQSSYAYGKRTDTIPLPGAGSHSRHVIEKETPYEAAYKGRKEKNHE